MKIVLALLAVALVATQAHSKPMDDEYFVGDISQIISKLKERFQERAKEITAQITATMEQLKTAKDDMKTVLKEQVAELKSRLLALALQFVNDVKKITAGQADDSYALSSIVEKFKFVAGKVVEKTKQLTAVVAQLAKETAAPKIEQLKRLRDELLLELQALRVDLKEKFAEILAGKNTAYSDNEMDVYIVKAIVEQLKARLAEVVESLKEKRNELATAVGDKKREVFETIKNLEVELRGIMSDIIQAAREMMGKGSSYSDLDFAEYGIVDQIREIRAMINEKLQEIQEKVEFAKMLSGVAKEEATKALQQLKTEVAALKDDLIQAFRAMFARS